MTILDLVLLSVAILVGVGSGLAVKATRSSSDRNARDAQQKSDDADQKYRQAREARNSVEDALRRAEDAHRQSERRLQQAQDALQAAEKIPQQAQAEVHVANDARMKAEQERDDATEQARLANERAQRALVLQKQAEDERDAANERARLAEQARTRTEEERDAARREREEAIQARNIAEDDARLANERTLRAEEIQNQAEENQRRAIQDKSSAEERVRHFENEALMANERATAAEKERDDAKEQARLAEQAEKRAECERDAAILAKANDEGKRDEAIKHAEIVEIERDTPNEYLEKEIGESTKKTLEPQEILPSLSSHAGEKPKAPTQSLIKRPPKRGEPQFHKTLTPRSPMPEIVCVQKQNEWMLRVELPQEWLEQCSDLQFFQNGVQLDGPEDSWQLNDARGNLVVRADDKIIWRTDLSERTEYPLLFKLSGKSEQGRRVRSVTQGWFLLVVPEDWIHTSYDLPIQFVSIKGYHAYCRLVDDRSEISFRTSNGKNKTVTPHVAQFSLSGKTLPDADESRCLLFGNELPCICAINLNTGQPIETIVVGEEGREREEWKSVAFVPDKDKAEQDLPPEVAEWKASWFFVRFYDEDDQLIESTDFRLARGLSKIQISQASPFPGENGHSTTAIEFDHTTDCMIESLSGVDTAADGNITLAEIPKNVTFDKTNWEVATHGHDPIGITILVERIWWAVGTNEKIPLDSEWIDKPLALTRDDFAANSEKILWMRLPKQRWTEEVQMGFAQEALRLFPIKVTQQTISVPLCDFYDSESLRQIGVSHFVIRADDSEATLSNVRVQAKCRYCGFPADSQMDMMSHIESRHLDTIFQPLEYAEYVRRKPELPLKILICKYPRCAAPPVLWHGPPENSTDLILDHIRQNKHFVDGHPHFEELNNVEKIRDRLPDLIPDIRRCTLRPCEWEKESPTESDFLRHLREDHPNALYELS